MNKLLTIIIPSYNMEAYLANCLSSLIVKDELMPLLDILVINDGSKDRTSEIAHEFSEKYPASVRVIDKENGNYGSCINRGLVEAAGTFIKVLDADDTFETSNFEQYVQLLQNMTRVGGGTDVDCIFTDFVMVKPDGKISKKINQKIQKNAVLPVSALPDNINDTMWMHAVTYKTENLLKIKYHQTEGISYTDQEWIFLPMSAVRKIYYWPHVLYKYLVGRNGQTMDPATYTKNMWMEIKGTKVMIEEYEKYKSTFLSENNKYLSAQVSRRSGYIYRWFLFIYKKYLNQKDLIAFDNYLKTSSPFIYERTEALPAGRIRFKFIHEWRKNQSDRTILFLLYGIYAFCVRTVKFPLRAMHHAVKMLKNFGVCSFLFFCDKV